MRARISSASGALLYEVLSGRRAFPGDSILETLNAVVSTEPPPLDSFLYPVVEKCLAKDLSERFHSAAELKAALALPSTKLESPRVSIAVLPFANMSGDPGQEYFSDLVRQRNGRGQKDHAPESTVDHWIRRGLSAIAEPRCDCRTHRTDPAQMIVSVL
jgi:serine/threonine protein kinase